MIKQLPLQDRHSDGNFVHEGLVLLQPTAAGTLEQARMSGSNSTFMRGERTSCISVMIIPSMGDLVLLQPGQQLQR